MVGFTCDSSEFTVAGQQYDYQKKNFIPTQEVSATRCTKGTAGSTPALCPVGVPLTDEGKPGSTACVTALNGTVSYFQRQHGLL